MKKISGRKVWHGALLALPLLTMSAATIAPVARVEAKAAKKGIQWQPSLQAAIKEAKRTGKPIMVDFFATWCGPCKMLDSETYTDASVIKESKRWISVKVDVDKEAKLAEKYKVSAMPTVAFLRPDGTLVTGFVGYQGPKDALKSIRAAYAKVKARPKISA